VDGKEVGVAPVSVRASWPDSRATVEVRAEREGYDASVRNLIGREASGAPDPWPVNLDLAPLKIARILSIDCNIEKPRVRINGEEQPGGQTTVPLVFVRDRASAPWSSATVEVAKEHYRYHPSSGPPSAAFQVTLDPDRFPQDGRLVVSLEPVRFYHGTIKRFLITPGEGVRTETEMVLSQIGDIESEPKASAVTMISESEEPLHETKLSVLPDGSGVVYVVPRWRPGENDPYGANLWLRRGVQKTRLTDGDFFDVTPSVSQDGKWVFFSSDRSGKQCIHRIQLSGKGGIGQVTDSPSADVDYEPTLSPDGTKLAFTSAPRGSKVPQVLLCNPDGTLRTQVREGQQPSWSPDGLSIAYIAEDKSSAGRRRAIWVMDADGSNPREIAYSPDCDYGHPNWHPSGREILFECNRNRAPDQTPQYDIWIIGADGTGPRALTLNPSYDVCPAITPDGRSIYFLSNRGVQEEMQNNLKIWRMELVGGSEPSAWSAK
jgi:Tol biopolymer transport system component